MSFYRLVLFLQRENLCDKDDDEDEHEEKYGFSDLVQEYSRHAEEKCKRVDEIANKVLGHPHIEESIVEMMDTVSGERILLVVETHEDDIESVYEIHSEHGRNGRDLSSGDDGKRRYHEGDKHGPGFSEQDKRFDAVEPADEHRRDEDRETQEYENGIGLGRGGWIDEIEFERQYRHDEQGHEGES